MSLRLMPTLNQTVTLKQTGYDLYPNVKRLGQRQRETVVIGNTGMVSAVIQGQAFKT